jgi:hypothetical protein
MTIASVLTCIYFAEIISIDEYNFFNTELQIIQQTMLNGRNLHLQEKILAKLCVVLKSTLNLAK